MEAVRYPTLSNHVAVHHQFEDKCLKWAEELKRGYLKPEPMLQFLQKWLVTHILHNDKKIASFMEIHHIDPSAFEARLESGALLAAPDSPDSNGPPTPPGCNVCFCRKAGLVRKAKTLRRHAATVFTILLLCSVVSLALLVTRSPRPPASPYPNPPPSSKSTAEGIRTGVDAVPVAVAACLVGVCGAVSYGVYRRANQLMQNERRWKIVNFQHLSEALLASQIATRIANMELDMEDMFTNADHESAMLKSLKSIVSNLKVIQPHLPSTVIALLRSPTGVGDGDNSDDEEAMSPKPPSILRNTPSALIPRTVSQHSNSPYPTVPPTPWSRANSSGHQAVPPTPKSAPVMDRSKSQAYLLNRTQSGAFSPTDVAISDVESVYEPRPHAIGPPRLLTKFMRLTTVTCMALRLKGFAELCDTLPVDVLLQLQGEYVQAIRDYAEGSRGVIQTVNGDTALCSWNACKPTGNHSVRACQAALSVCMKVAQSAAQRTVDLQLHVGIATGRAHVGIMGCEAKKDFAILSAALSVCNALLELNSSVGTTILLDSETWADVSLHVQCEAVAPFETKTYSGELEVTLAYELKGMRQTENDEWMYTLRNAEREDPFVMFNAAVNDFVSGQWNLCEDRLVLFLQRQPDHLRANALLRLCRERAAANQAPAPTPRFGWQNVDLFVPRQQVTFLIRDSRSASPTPSLS
eukprot:TRINITY_DN18851_c0_g1_i1.p1 TRINITY_DN18851_c0_g1~~TRINITY_DN18851_c0_g1_i1.p1  ORF type:complete len:770 (-),score=104.66 TRINITY_DN18851_c0_g1_i1:190-2268(-)